MRDINFEKIKLKLSQTTPNEVLQLFIDPIKCLGEQLEGTSGGQTSKKWNALTYLINLPQNNETSPLSNYETNKPLKFLPQYCNYTYGSFLPSQQIHDSWAREKARYGVCNQFKSIELAIRLPGLQNIFKVELMVIYATLKIINEEYPNEPVHMLTNCLNRLYIINTQIKHPTLHNNHPDKIISQEIVELLQQKIQSTTLYKVQAHANIEGNEKADELA